MSTAICQRSWASSWLYWLGGHLGKKHAWWWIGNNAAKKKRWLWKGLSTASTEVAHYQGSQTEHGHSGRQKWSELRKNVWRIRERWLSEEGTRQMEWGWWQRWEWQAHSKGGRWQGNEGVRWVWDGPRCREGVLERWIDGWRGRSSNYRPCAVGKMEELALSALPLCINPAEWNIQPLGLGWNTSSAQAHATFTHHSCSIH